MCTESSKGIKLQCACKCEEESDNSRITDLHKLSSEQRKNIPTENLYSYIV